MKTVGQSFQVAFSIRLDQTQSIANDAVERLGLAFEFADQEA